MELGTEGVLNAMIRPHDLVAARLRNSRILKQFLTWIVRCKAAMILCMPVATCHDEIELGILAQLVDEWNNFK